MSAAKRYVQMIKDETSVPKWMGGRVEYYDGDAEYTSNPKSKDQSVTNVERSSTGKMSDSSDPQIYAEPAKAQKTGLSKYWAVIAAGAGLFSDGYLNNCIGFVMSLLKRIYGTAAIKESNAMSNISAIVFVGNVVGMVGFGFFADHVSRKMGMMISTVILIVFSILLAGAWGVGMPTNPQGMFAAMTVYRAILGVGIGGEYPAGSVACAEVSQMLPKGSRNRWFVWFTNFMIDSGYVVAALTAWILLYICGVPTTDTGTHGMQTAWRVLFGLGAIAPMTLFYIRLKFEDNDQFKENSLKRVKTPYWLCVKYYGPRWCIVSLIWFLYDFCGYSWGIYSSQIIEIVVPNANIKTTFGWNVLLNVFYLPGSLLGAYSADYFGPRITLFLGVGLQGIIGFIMCSQYTTMIQNAAGFIVAYGIFITLGEFGPGDNIGLIASKTSSSAIRGRYYGTAAAIGKIGAFAGGYAFPAIANHYGGLDTLKGQTVLLYLSSSMCILSALLVLLLPALTQTAVADEDRKFREYLENNGFDTSLMGHGN